MKKFLILLLAAVMAVAMVACSPKEADDAVKEGESLIEEAKDNVSEAAEQGESMADEAQENVSEALEEVEDAVESVSEENKDN